jgi:ABC-2 type transport system ATP-binding protein
MIDHYAKRMNFRDELDTLLENTSSGTRKKAAFTAVILHEPLILLLDEPFSNIDILIAEEMINILKELKSRGATIVLSSHNMYEIESLADNILLIHNGNAICFQTLEYFTQNNASLKQTVLQLIGAESNE